MLFLGELACESSFKLRLWIFKTLRNYSLHITTANTNNLESNGGYFFVMRNRLGGKFVREKNLSVAVGAGCQWTK